MTTMRDKFEALGFLGDDLDLKIHAALDELLALRTHLADLTVCDGVSQTSTPTTVPTLMHEPTIREIADRARRIETRLTRYMEAQGFDTQVQRPQWIPPAVADAAGLLVMPSLHTSFDMLLDAVPTDWPPTRPIALMHKQDHVATLLIPERVA